jgi:hypothetical protein
VIDPAKLALVDPQPVGEASMKVVDVLQKGHKPMTQAAAIGYVFLLLCKQHDVHPGTVLQVSQRLIDDTPRHTPEMKAVAMYLEKQIKNGT